MTAPTAVEREILELINRARMDPSGETARMLQLAASDPDVRAAVAFFNVDLALFQQQMTTYQPVAPLAWSSALGVAAARHSQLMIDFDTQSHQLPGEPGLGQRVADAGYCYTLVGENVFAYGKNAVESHAAFYIDWGFGPGGIQSPAGHRDNIMDPRFSEAGISAIPEMNGLTEVGPLVVTHNLGADTDIRPYLLGVVFDNKDGDGFYDAGEGLAGASVTATGSAGTFTTASWAAGGYQILVPAGTYTVTFSGGGLPSPLTKTVTIGAVNVKVDGVLQEIQPPATGTPTAGDDVIVLLPGNETIDGLEGHDTVVTGTSGANVSITVDAGGVTLFDRNGPGGVDRLVNVEVMLFSDGSIDLNSFQRVVTVSPAQFTELTEMYVAYFNRAADALGLYFWADALAQGVALDRIAELFFDQDETRALYAGSSDTEAFVTAVYANVLGRTPDAEGFAFWQEQVASGSVDVGRFVLEIIRGAKATTGDSGDVEYLSAKAELGLYFSVIHGLSDVNDAAQAMAVFGDQPTSDLAGARGAIDGHFADATIPGGGELTVALAGIVDDPFMSA